MLNKRRTLDTETARLTGDLAKTIRRLRVAGGLSLGELSERSGVAKSIVSQIETGETNPTLATVRKLARALNAPIEHVLWRSDEPALLEKFPVCNFSAGEGGGGVRLDELSWSKTADTVRWRHIAMEPGASAETPAHPLGAMENLTVISGALVVDADGRRFSVGAGETARYHVTAVHRIANEGTTPASAIQVSLLKLPRRQGVRELNAGQPRRSARSPAPAPCTLKLR